LQEASQEVTVPTRRTGRADVPCPIARAADVLGDRWTLLIMRNATLGTTRFDDFRADLGIADNVLSTRLARLVETGLLAKVPYRDGGRTRHEYRLTTAGADLLPILHTLADWGQRHTTPAEPAEPMRMIHRTCGHVIDSAGCCDHCGRTIGRAEVSWLRPWRSPDPVALAEPVGSPGD
jgi:DNA-binding HxlR family transcriptional regulator